VALNAKPRLKESKAEGVSESKLRPIIYVTIYVTEFPVVKLTNIVKTKLELLAYIENDRKLSQRI